MMRFTTGARTYSVRNGNPALSSVVLVNPRKRGASKRARNRHKVDAVAEAVRSGLLSRGSARRLGRKSNRKAAKSRAGVMGSPVKRKAKKRSKKRRVLKENRTMATRRRKRAASKRRNPRKRRAGRRATTVRRRKNRKSTARRAPARRKRRRKANRKAPAKRRKSRRKTARKAAPKRRRRNRRRTTRRAAPKRRRNRRKATRRAAPKRRRNRRRSGGRRRAAPKRRRNRRGAFARTTRRTPRRRNRRRGPARRRNYGFSMGGTLRTRGYVGGRRRRNRGSSAIMPGGFFGTIKAAVKDLPSALKTGLNIGAGVLVTGLVNGVVDRFAGAYLGRFTGLGSAFVSMLLIGAAGRFGFVKKLPVVSTNAMLGGAGLYAVMQLGRLFLPDSIKSRVGLSAYDRHLPAISGLSEYVRTGGMGDYVREPWAGPASQSVSGVGEYVRNGSDAYDAASLLQDAMRPGDPMARANQLATASEAAGSLGGYVRTGADVGSAMGGLGSFWLSRGQYATSAHPSAPDQRLKQYEYGRVFAGLGLAPTVAQEAAVAVIEKEAAGMPPQQAIETTADEYGCTSCATSVPCGVLPIDASLPGGEPVPEIDGDISAGGMFANPFANIS